MTNDPFVSYAQNGEDVVLWRALHSVTPGRYVEVGANDPKTHSISRAFYDRGWSGLEIEPVPAFAQRFREARPRDTVVEAAITSQDVESITLHVIPDSGLSTLRDDVGAEHARSGWPVEAVSVPARRLDDVLDEHVPAGEDVHFLVIDTEGAERQVLESIDLKRWRPWVVVIEATAPMSAVRTHEAWESLVTDAGYQFCLFDGLSRWYVADEHAELTRLLDHPACALDPWISRAAHEAEQRVDVLTAENAELLEQLIKWRGKVLTHWAEAASAAVHTPGAGGVASHESARLRAELDAMHETLSWRVTAPLRDVRSAQLRRSRRA
ncbi:FkbM family methyltransferase [Modestobacter sp. VKM Ac-2985]|uniref:FkbM family methyltransferase n=1 Tax=Modestobacter sp. VKM Ac-2985 TaxID=3004139 RepID=UPI0022ABB322|nr:FkbM family methyltransferase [Modestobacter sp. VKM Ac-2985]MCZ2838593.1 FkbM family methyltransferase [Modestobacter sp. VKM Ac-2985]